MNTKHMGGSATHSCCTIRLGHTQTKSSSNEICSEPQRTESENGNRVITVCLRFFDRVDYRLVYRGLTPQQQPGSYEGGEMMMKSVFWWRKPEYPEETTDLRQVTDETFHTYGLCPVRGLNLGRSGVKQSELRRDESGALGVMSYRGPSTELK